MGKMNEINTSGTSAAEKGGRR